MYGRGKECLVNDLLEQMCYAHFSILMYGLLSAAGSSGNASQRISVAHCSPLMVFHPSQIASMMAIVAPSGSHILISLNRLSACAKSMRQSASSRSLELNKLHMRMSMFLVYVSQTVAHVTVPGSSYRICRSFDHDKVFGSGMRWSFTMMRAPGFKAGTVASSILIT